ncbi:MAG TPA: MBL fold metallo-hydrolase [Solirubrobacterales bacterium]|nr:MBL fold metallo-hydrolase [Solirubrobacterales bacterium]
MRVEWHGQSAFTLSGGSTTVVIDPFQDMSELVRDRGMTFDYPPFETSPADLLLVTHEHRDHNAVERVGGSPHTLRSTAGTHESPLGEVVGIASEHDEVAGTERGPNTIFVFELEGLRVVHFGDFGQDQLRPAQAQAIGRPDLLFLPVGGGPTIGGRAAAELAADLDPTWVVPMHYRTPRIDFLEDEEEFVAAMPAVQRLDSPIFDTAELRRSGKPLAVIPAAP